MGATQAAQSRSPVLHALATCKHTAAQQARLSRLTLGDLQPGQLGSGLRRTGAGRAPHWRSCLSPRPRAPLGGCRRRFGGCRRRWPRLCRGGGIGADLDAPVGRVQALGCPHLLPQALQGGAVVRQVVLLRADDGAGAAHADVPHRLLSAEPKVLDHVGADEHAGAPQARLAVHLQAGGGDGRAVSWGVGHEPGARRHKAHCLASAARRDTWSPQ